jgi:soluble lytic murein transglycosylase-like protein
MKFALPLTLLAFLLVFLIVYRSHAEKISSSNPMDATANVSKNYLPSPPSDLFASVPALNPATPSPQPNSPPAAASANRKEPDTHAIIRAAAKKHGVPAAFVKSIVAAESNFNPNAVSPKGAVGLMQLMPQTAHEMGADPRVPAQNVDAGTRYLRLLINKYRGSRNWLKRVIAAYNAGPGMVDKYRGVPPFPETRTYVTRVLSYLREFRKDPTLAVGGLRLPAQ